MENSGLKVIYLDIMVGEKFLTQIPYHYCPLFPIDIKEVEKFVLEKRPTLKNKKFRIEFATQRV